MKSRNSLFDTKSRFWHFWAACLKAAHLTGFYRSWLDRNEVQQITMLCYSIQVFPLSHLFYSGWGIISKIDAWACIENYLFFPPFTIIFCSPCSGWSIDVFPIVFSEIDSRGVKRIVSVEDQGSVVGFQEELSHGLLFNREPAKLRQ